MAWVGGEGAGWRKQRTPHLADKVRDKDEGGRGDYPNGTGHKLFIIEGVGILMDIPTLW